MVALSWVVSLVSRRGKMRMSLFGVGTMKRMFFLFFFAMLFVGVLFFTSSLLFVLFCLMRTKQKTKKEKDEEMNHEARSFGNSN